MDDEKQVMMERCDHLTREVAALGTRQREIEEKVERVLLEQAKDLQDLHAALIQLTSKSTLLEQMVESKMLQLRKRVELLAARS